VVGAEAVTAAKEIIVHLEPVWRGRANFVISAELPEKDRPYQFEQLWVQQLSDDEFELCCIPFFLYDVALGDVVRTAAKSGRRYVLDRVIKPSGHYTFRVWFGHSFHPRDEIAAELSDIGALVERSSLNLLAVDAMDSAHAQKVADYLEKREKAKQLMYEAGRTA
jgi:hypothetical protein